MRRAQISGIALLAVTLGAMSLVLGGNRTWVWASGGTLLATGWVFAVGRERHGAWRHPVGLLLLAWILWQGVQLVPFPAVVTQFISPAAGAIWSPVAKWAPVSIAPGKTAEALLLTVMAGLVFLAATGIRGGRARRLLLWVLVVLGAVHALLAMTANTFGLDITRLFSSGVQAPGGLHGSFINRNHFANFLALCLAAGVGLLMYYWSATLRSGTERLAGRLTGFLLGPGAFLSGLLAVACGGLLLSQSRGAVLAFGAALAAGGGLLWWRLGRRGLAFAGLGAGALALALLLGDYTQLVTRFQEGELFAGERLEQWRQTLPLVSDFWLTGAGAGTYADAFAAYKDDPLRLTVYDHAHNDFLELLAEQGIIGLSLVGAFLVALLRTLGRTIGKATTGDALLATGLAIGVFTFLLHALVGFAWHVPVNLCLFFLIAGLAVGLDLKYRETQ